jgi:hypothetical protein
VYEAKFGVGTDSDFEEAIVFAGGDEQIVENLKAALGRRAMEVHDLRKLAIVPNHAEEFVFQFFAPCAGGHADRMNVFGAEVGIADDADAREPAPLSFLCRAP